MATAAEKMTAGTGKTQRIQNFRRKEARCNGRRIMSRSNRSALSIIDVLPVGKMTKGCCVCCHAPSCCAMCSLCPCCDDSEYVVMKRDASKYFYIRENSVEWNDPSVTMSPGPCCGVDPCLYDVQDNVRVVYYDDAMFLKLTNTTRFCNEFRTCLCGGRGERIQISAPCCFGLAYRASCPCVCMCVPICCPTALFPCALRHEIYLEDAEQGIYAIKDTMKITREKKLYRDDMDVADDYHKVLPSQMESR